MSRKLPLIFIFLLISSLAQAKLQNGMDADVVLGQNSFSDTDAIAANQFQFNPRAMSAVGNRFFVADSTNRRILIWNSVPKVNRGPADVVVGQDLFTDSGGSVTQKNISQPLGVISDGKSLFVADNGGRRLLIWRSIPTTNGTLADVVLGQANFTSSTNINPPTQRSTNGIRGIATCSEKLFSVNRNHNVILAWNTIPTTNNAPGDFVIGQPNFTSSTANNGGISARTLSSPEKAVCAGGRFYVADSSNNRVLIWNKIPTTNFEPADVVLGQPDFISNNSNNGGVSARSMDSPQDLISDGKSLFIADQNNNRVLIWKSVPTKNGQPADFVIGQSDFHLKDAGVSQRQCAASSVTFNGKQLFVGDTTNRRILIFNLSGESGIELGPQFTQGKSLVGKVFEDKNGNGEQDGGEKGMEGVKVASDSGIYAITDSDGKYHFPYIETGQRVLKIDESTLPEGSSITTESPRKITITEGILSKVSFGVRLTGDGVDQVHNAPLLKASIFQDPLLLKPKLSIDATQDKDKLTFTIHTNYSLFIKKAEIILYDNYLKPFETIELPSPIPYEYSLYIKDLPDTFNYQLKVMDSRSREDRTKVAAIMIQ